MTIGRGRRASDPCGNIRRHTNSSDNELVGHLRFVFLEQEAVFAYFVRDREAFVLRPTEKTVYTGVKEIGVGDGVGYAGRLMHSGSTYRLRGTASDDASEQLRLVSINTRRFTVDSIELVEPGTGPCTVYFGILLPPTGGFVPVLPESVRGKRGTLVQDGTGNCKVVMADTGRGQQPTNSFVANGSLNLNKQVSWAAGESEALKK